MAGHQAGHRGRGPQGRRGAIAHDAVAGLVGAPGDVGRGIGDIASGHVGDHRPNRIWRSGGEGVVASAVVIGGGVAAAVGGPDLVEVGRSGGQPAQAHQVAGHRAGHRGGGPQGRRGAIAHDAVAGLVGVPGDVGRGIDDIASGHVGNHRPGGVGLGCRVAYVQQGLGEAVRVAGKAIGVALRRAVRNQGIPNRVCSCLVGRFPIDDDVQRRRPGRVRRSHAGATYRVVRAVVPRREDAHPRRGDVHVCAKVAEAGKRVVLGLRAVAEHNRLVRQAPADSVEVSDGGDRDDVRMVGGAESGSVLQVIPSSHCVNNALGNRAGDGGVQRRALTLAAQAHVGHVNLVRVVRHPVDASDDPRHPAGAAVVQDPHGPQAGAWGHAHDAYAVVQGRGGACDVSPVAVAVVTAAILAVAAEGTASGAVGGCVHVQIGMIQVYPCIDDGDVNIHPVVDAVDVSRGVQVGVDAVDSGRDLLRECPDDLVALYEGDSGVALHVRHPARWDEEGGALESVAVDELTDEAVRLRQVLGCRVCVHAIVKDHDVRSRASVSGWTCGGGHAAQGQRHHERTGDGDKKSCPSLSRSSHHSTSRYRAVSASLHWPRA